MRNMRNILLIFTIASLHAAAFSQVGIGTSTPAASSILDLSATDKGLLIPRVANSDVISSPTNGMMIYAINTKCFKTYEDGVWNNLTTCTPILSAMTFDGVSYNGVSSIDAMGIGYNGEAVSPLSTIIVEVTVSEPTPYHFSAEESFTGLTYSAMGNFSAAGSFSVALTPNNVVIPKDIFGIFTLPLTGASNSIDLTARIDVKSVPASETEVVEVLSLTGKIWMDRNLGAVRAAEEETDALAYGNMYQWGRGSDGHEQIVTSAEDSINRVGLYGTTTTVSATDTPENNLFIIKTVFPVNWTTTGSSNLWAGVSGINNPCPAGFRVPTISELTAEVTAYGITNSASAFASPLKFTMAGFRGNTYGLFNDVGERGLYWSSTGSGDRGSLQYFDNVETATGNYVRALGLPIRCIKE